MKRSFCSLGEHFGTENVRTQTELPHPMEKFELFNGLLSQLNPEPPPHLRFISRSVNFMNFNDVSRAAAADVGLSVIIKQSGQEITFTSRMTGNSSGKIIPKKRDVFLDIQFYFSDFSYVFGHFSSNIYTFRS